MISVVIPVLNESATVADVVRLAWRDPDVSEVLVVDDGSIDGTPDAAREAGAVVLTSTLLGKGASMEDGMRAATQELVVYLDGDLHGLSEDLIARLKAPLLSDQADFVKARFTRTAGRVTTLTARPLLRLFFPELAHFEQPLGGIMAARRSLLQRLTFETDYGVDVGLLIDAAVQGARLVEVDVGHIEHDSHPLELLGDMAAQVVRTIMARAARHGRLKGSHLLEVQEIERHMEAEIGIALQKFEAVEKLALFDMDGVLLDGRYVVELARQTAMSGALSQYLDNLKMDPGERTRAIAALFTGVPRTIFEQVARDMPLQAGARQLVLELRKRGYRVCIVTDSFQVAAEIVRRRVFADFAFANLMRFQQGKATGRVTLSPAMIHPRGCPLHVSCKVNVLHHLTERLGLGREQILAVGDGENDICMLRAAGCSFAFRPKSDAVRAAAQRVLDGQLDDILTHVE